MGEVTKEEKATTTARHHSTGAVDPVRRAEDGPMVDAVWGEIGDNGPNYRNLGWIRGSVLEVKTQIGLGVLGIPAVLDTLGYVPGVLVIVALAIIITWSDYVIGIFKLRHPEVYTLADVGMLIGGPVGREVLGFAFWLEGTAIAGSGLLSVSVAFNAITSHGTCTVVFTVVAAIVNIIISSVQTLDRISWVGWVGLVSILSALITLTVAVGVNPPDHADKVVKVASQTSFVDAINSVSIVVFAYAGTPNYFSIVGEMRNQKDYTKSVIVSQTVVTVVYLVIGCTVYHYVGQYISNPALGSAGEMMKKVCYGLSLPALWVGCILYTHIPAKYVFVRLLRNSKHLSENTIQHRVIWYSCVIVNCLISFIIAEAIPFFGDLVSLIGALLGTFICIQTETYMWIWDNWRSPTRGTLSWKLLMLMNFTFMGLGWFAMVAGTYGAVVSINDSFAAGDTSTPFSCADNSG